MSERTNNEKPEVYALYQDGGSWQISRRDFLKAAGIGAAAVGVGLNSRLIRPAYAEDSIEELCRSALTHTDTVTKLFTSADGKYLLSFDGSVVKCWDFATMALMGSKTISNINIITAGLVRDKSCLVYHKTSTKEIVASELPDMNSDYRIAINFIGSDQLFDIQGSRNGDLYLRRLDQSAINNKKYRVTRIEKGSGPDLYDTFKNLYTSSEEFLSFAPFDGGRKLLITTADKKFKIFDIESETAEDLEIPAAAEGSSFSIISGDTAAFYAESNPSTVAAHYGLASLTDGSMIWSENISAASDSPKFSSTAVTPDGSIGLLLGKQKDKTVWLFSMKSGKLLGSVSLGSASEDCLNIAVAGDGSKFAVANEKSIFFISLPDGKIIGCPVDLDEMKDNVKGIKVSVPNPVTGQTVTQTLPCGAPIPAGAVCVCNCVAGSKPSCSCHGHCTCNSNRTTYGGHYWHPN